MVGFEGQIHSFARWFYAILRTLEAIRQIGARTFIAARDTQTKALSRRGIHRMYISIESRKMTQTALVYRIYSEVGSL